MNEIDDPTLSSLGIQSLIDKINEFVEDGKLSSARASSLISMLSSAQTNLDDGEDTQAKLKLQSVISRINNFMNRGHVDQPDGQLLIDLANSIISGIGT